MKRILTFTMVTLVLILMGGLSLRMAHASDTGCTNGDCPPPDPDCTNGDCPLPDPGCTNGDCPPDPGCTNGDCPPDPDCTNGDCPPTQDADDDGYSAYNDCNDHDSSVHPYATEICDGEDNNCNGLLGVGEEDLDGDGYLACKTDCDDLEGMIHSNAYDLPGNAVDENCDGSLGACDPDTDWKNHGQFVRCVAHEVDDLIALGILTQEKGDELIANAAKSDVGKR